MTKEEIKKELESLQLAGEKFLREFKDPCLRKKSFQELGQIVERIRWSDEFISTPFSRAIIDVHDCLRFYPEREWMPLKSCEILVKKILPRLKIDMKYEDMDFVAEMLFIAGFRPWVIKQWLQKNWKPSS